MNYRAMVEASSEEYLEQIGGYYYHFLRKNNIEIPKNEFLDNLFLHPNFPSIVAFLDICESIGIEVVLINELEIESDTCALIISGNTTNNFAPTTIVTNHDDSYFTVSEKGKKSEIDRDEYLKLIESYVIIMTNNNCEENPDFLEMQTMKNKRYMRTYVQIAFFLIALILSTLASIGSNYFFTTWINLILSGLGVYTSILIFHFFNGSNLSNGPKVCNVASQDEGCHKTLNFKPLKNLPIDIPSLTTSYFVSQCALLIYAIDSPSALHFLAALSVLALPFIFISLILQALIIRSWCKLCLIISALLISQFLIYLPLVLSEHFTLSLNNILWGSTVLFSLTALIANLAQYFPAVIRYTKTFQQLQRIRSNPFYITENYYYTDIHFPKNDLDLIMGDKNGRVEIQLLLSLDCGGCAMVFEDLKQILKSNIRGLKVRIKLIPIEHNNTYKVIWKQCAAKEYKQAFKFMDTIYSQLNTSVMESTEAARLNADIDIQEPLNQLINWREKENIEYSPMMAINGDMYVNTSLMNLMTLIRRKVRSELHSSSDIEATVSVV